MLPEKAVLQPLNSDKSWSVYLSHSGSLDSRRPLTTGNERVRCIGKGTEWELGWHDVIGFHYERLSSLYHVTIDAFVVQEGCCSSRRKVVRKDIFCEGSEE